MSQYVCLAVPVAHAEVVNRVLNQVNGDVGDNIAQDFSGDGHDPTTYKVGGWPVTDEKLALYPYAKSAAFTPDPNGPLAAYTQQQIDDAVDALEKCVRDGASATLSEDALNVICANLDIQRVVRQIEM